MTNMDTPPATAASRSWGAALMTSCRPTDVVGRYGGEEFAVLLPNADCRAAVIIANRMLHRVRDLCLENKQRHEGIVTISFGVASLVPNPDQTTPDHLVEAADRALYKAKRDGRDRICWTIDE